MDALPIAEQTEADYRSTVPGVMHACGHDAHMSVGCGVAVLARERRAELAGTVRVFFQPCEERTPSGAPAMIRAGVLDGVAAAYAVHVDPGLPVGRFGFRAGSLTAACAPWRMIVRSDKSGHSARPHEAVDTVWVATQIANDLYQLAGRVTDARKAAVLTICRFQAGDALNVIPSEVEFGGHAPVRGQRDDGVLAREDAAAGGRARRRLQGRRRGGPGGGAAGRREHGSRGGPRPGGGG